MKNEENLKKKKVKKIEIMKKRKFLKINLYIRKKIKNIMKNIIKIKISPYFFNNYKYDLFLKMIKYYIKIFRFRIRKEYVFY
jgi:hypothetical protein